MAAIRGRENRTEVALRRYLHKLGLRFRKYVHALPGSPDIVFPSAKVVVFVDGDFWHGRLLQERGIKAVRETLRTPNREYWVTKLQRNSERDMRVDEELKVVGWKVIRVWESEAKNAIGRVANSIAAVVRRRRRN
jgi:DNA mismatch endonuclease (patch repair protein)